MLTTIGDDVARAMVVGTITGEVVLVVVEDVVVGAATGATVGATAVVVEVVVITTVVVVVVVVVVPVLINAPALSATKLSPMCDVLVPARVVLSDPRRPLPPLPQHFTSALSSMAHVCAPPADTASTLRPVPRLTVASASPI